MQAVMMAAVVACALDAVGWSFVQLSRLLWVLLRSCERERKSVLQI
jgi:hypothetical protein